MARFSILATLSFLLFSTSTLAASQCYFVNGLPATDNTFQPCNPNAAQSTCCNLGKVGSDGTTKGDTCLNNGLCMAADPTSGNGLIFATGCTDSTGSDSTCPQMCKGATDKNHGTYALNPCPDGKWCCLGWGGTINSTCCINGTTGSFEFDLLGLKELSATASSSSASGTAKATSASVSSTSGTAAGTAGVAQPTQSSCPKDKSATVGAAVGVVLGIAFLAALAAAIIMARRLGSFKRQYNNEGAPAYSGMANVPAYAHRKTPVELDQTPVMEMDATPVEQAEK